MTPLTSLNGDFRDTGLTLFLTKGLLKIGCNGLIQAPNSALWGQGVEERDVSAADSNWIIVLSFCHDLCLNAHAEWKEGDSHLRSFIWSREVLGWSARDGFNAAILSTE